MGNLYVSGAMQEPPQLPSIPLSDSLQEFRRQWSQVSTSIREMSQKVELKGEYRPHSSSNRSSFRNTMSVMIRTTDDEEERRRVYVLFIILSFLMTRTADDEERR